VFFSGFGDSSLDFHLLVWIDQPKRQYEITSDLNFRIEAVLRNRGITIPFPQRDLHLGGEDLAISLSAPLNEALIQLLERSRSEPDAGPAGTEDR
jgi:small-conductance mechanosensitive channel